MERTLVESDVSVAMRDGVELATDVYRPADDEPHPTLVQRTPYDKSNPQAVSALMFSPHEAARRGYAVVVQDVRGRFASDGEWEPVRNEAEDGYDTVEWAAERDWSDGSVGIYGPSYMGAAAWQAALADPPHLEAAFPCHTGGNYHSGFTYTGGAFELGFNLWWVTFMLAFDTADRLDLPAEEAGAVKRSLAELSFDLETAAERLPVADVPGFEDAAPYWEDWHQHPAYGEYWESIDVTAQADRIEVPVLHLTGWYDQCLRGHLDNYRAVDEEGGERARENQHLVIGPWYHSQYMSEAMTKVGDRELGVKAPSGLPFIEDLAFQWFDRWLNGTSDAIDHLSRVRYFTLGEDDWNDAEMWPPDHTKTEYYLHSNGDANTRFGDGRLTPEVPDSEVPDSYEYDPLDPVPSRGGRSIMPNLDTGGIRDRSEVEERADVLVYTSPRLTSPLALAGPVTVTLYAASSAPDTDFTATLVDVTSDGYCAPIAEGIVRARYRESRREATFLEPGTVNEFRIDLSSTAYTVQRGHRLRLEVSSSNFPRFDRNPNADVPVGQATESDVNVATQRVLHDSEHPSHVALPIRVDE